ncbi:endo-1,4-beta-xylanase [uncultured Draconibacterium sp.]|uniref:endo-1,4-beta-xylanase n=1 Tax=uncultured Draconibacterium sp. TaxID=1573823 RepID=UPI0025FC0CE4|nr:endo-1,4-beta-xylanase [uncultured Draconibacterium sp.]
MDNSSKINPGKLYFVFVFAVLSFTSFSQDNLLTNGDFENGTVGWQVWGAKMEITSDAHQGNNAVLISNRKNPWDALTRDVKSLLENGETYTISAWVKIPDAAKNFRITLGLKVDGVNSYTSLCRTDSPKIGDYEFYTQNFTVEWQGNLQSANIYIETESVNGVYSDYLADDIMLSKFVPEPEAEITAPGFKDMTGLLLFGGVIGGEKNYFNNETAKAQVLNDCNTIQITCYPAWGRWDESKKHVYYVDEFSTRIKEMKSQNLTTTAHMLMGWDKYYPEWFRKGDFPADTLDAIMKSWLEAIISSNGNDTLVDNWNVVNEAISWDGHGGYWPLFNANYEGACEFQRMGFEADASGLTGEQFVNAEHPVYIRKAFEYARTLTDKKLELRDSGFEFPGSHKYNAFYQLAKHLKEVGAPVDVIGFQTHLDIDKTYDWEGYANNIKRYIELGYEVIVAEVDIGDTEKDWNEEKAELQKKQYYNLINAAIKGGATEFHTWGFIDNNETGWRYGESAFPYANNFEKKPAWFGIKKALIDMSSVLYWEMEENIKDTMPDVMKYNNFGVIKNNIQPEFVKGYLTNAMQFDGVDDFIITENLSHVIREDLTFSCFVKTTSQNTSVLTSFLSGDEDDLKIGIGPEGKVYVEGMGIGSGELVSQDLINDGIWHFIAVQRDSNIYRLYVDNKEPVAITQGQIQEIKKLTVAANLNGNENFKGVIDEVKLFDSAIEEASFERNYLIENEITLEFKFSRMRVKLTWNDNGNEEIGYVIDRKTGEGDWEVAGEVNAGVDYFIETVDLYDTVYTYRVRSAERFANAGASNEVEVQTPNDPNTSALNYKEDFEFSVYPNPAENKFTFKSLGYADVKIFNVQGKLMLEKVNIPGSFDFNISDFQSGIYFIQAIKKGRTEVLKLVKK